MARSQTRMREATVGALAVPLGCVVMTACTSPTAPGTAASSPSTAPVSTAAIRADDSVGSYGAEARHLSDGCDHARPITYPFPTHNDLDVGPLS